MTSILLVLGPWLLECLAISPRVVREFGTPATVLLPLVIASCLPYLTVALSVAALAYVWSRTRLGVAPRARTRGLVLVGLALLVMAGAWTRPAVDDVLLGLTSHQFQRSGLLLGKGGLWGLRLPTQVLPLEEAGEFAAVTAQPGGGQVGVYVHRLQGQETGGSAELLGNGHRVDLSAELEGLKPGQSRFIQASLPGLTAGARVELRALGAQQAPIRFYDPEFRSANVGFSLESGGGNTAYRAEDIDQARLAQASFALVRGNQVAGGYTVLVFAGEKWTRHDLSGLRAAGGVIEIDLRHEEPPAFVARVIGSGQQSADIPLAQFARQDLGHRCWRYRYPLAAVDWQELSPANVSGLALLHTGALGNFELRIERVALVPTQYQRSGLGVLAVANFVPSAKPLKALFAAGPQREISLLSEHQVLVRTGLAILLVVGMLGPAALARCFWLRPVAGALAVLAGPLASVLVDAALPNIVIARPEHVGVMLALFTFGTLVVAKFGRESRIQEPAPAAAPAGLPRVTGLRFRHVDALKTIAMLGIIGIHVSADPFGTPYEAYPAEQRLFPVLLRALTSPFDIGIFIAASFLLLAHSLAQRHRPYPEQITHRLARLLPPFVFWSVVYLGLRFFKASAFGYVDALQAELSELLSWLRYAFLGSAQYHLHFLPFLAGLTLLYPIFRLAGRGLCSASLLLVGSLAAWFYLDGRLYGLEISPEIRIYWLRATKTLGYLGFGVLAFAFHRDWQQKRFERHRWVWIAGVLAVVAVAAVPVYGHALQEAAAGRWLPPSLATHLGKHLLLAGVFVLFGLSDRIAWPAWLTKLGALTFGVYLVHPIVLDLLEIAQRQLSWSPATRCVVNLVLVAVVSFLLVAALARVPALRWMIGLDRSQPR